MERARQSIKLGATGVLNDPRKYNMPVGKKKMLETFSARRETRSFSTLGYKAAKVAQLR